MEKITLGSMLLLFATICSGQSIEKAQMLLTHGLVVESKSEFINIIFSKETNQDKAQSYLMLGNIAFENGDITLATQTWAKLKALYPQSEQAKLASSLSDSLVGALTETTNGKLDNLTAQAYIVNGDFYSSGKNTKWTLDTSFIPSVDAAIKWYDKVIADFPKSKASKLAYEKKIQTLIGWKDRGQYGASYGLEDDFVKYMHILIETATQYFEEYPDKEYKHPIRFQIAQAFWRQKIWPNAEDWLKVIIDKSENDSFYKDLAQRRLNHLKF
jgi:tetratricopeptide (TPR) repeat protein